MGSAVVYLVDAKGYDLARHAAAAFMMTQTGFDDLYLFCHGFAPANADSLIALGRDRGVAVQLRPIAPRLALNQASTRAAHLSGTAYLKFEAIAAVMPAHDRIVYVDHDILFFEDVSLPSIALDGYPLGAVYDIAEVGGLTDPDFVANCTRHGRSPHYFNSGVMVFDAARWDPDWEAQYLRLYARHREVCDYKTHCQTRDQCLFNALFEGNWKRLPLEYNMQVSTKFSAEWAHAPVRHFQGPHKFLPVKPWRNDSRDLGLLAAVRSALGEPPFRVPAAGLAYALNALRNRPRAERGLAALAVARRMLAEPHRSPR